MFSLITGYEDAPAGIQMKGNLNYNPYFEGGAIAMARNLYDGVVEYEDGTPATTSQMAKDVTTFLTWAAEPEMEDRKKTGIKALAICGALVGTMLYWKRHRWSLIKSTKMIYKP